MYLEVTRSIFEEYFKAIRKNSFSYFGLIALFDYLEDLEERTDSKIEFNVIAIDMEFTEYDSLEEIQADYDISSIEELRDYTTVIAVPENEHIIIQPNTM